MKLRCPVCRKFFAPTRRDAVTCSVRCRVARQRKIQAITPPWPEGGPFDLVVVDLPLRWVARSPKREGRSPQAHYATMDVPALIWQLRPMLEAVMARDCIAGFWVYGPCLPDTLRVLEETGFIYKTELLVWEKLTRAGNPKNGMGKTTRKNIENMWGSSRGKGLRIRDHKVDQLIKAPWRGNSVKPDEAYYALERLYGDVRRLELYARKRRPGWTPWGNEVADLASAAAE